MTDLETLRRQVPYELIMRILVSKISDHWSSAAFGGPMRNSATPLVRSVKSAPCTIVIALIVAFGHLSSAIAENYLCRQQFALCTSAPCIPQPGNDKVAMCSCDVEDGPSLASVACDTVKPSTDANGVRTLYSQFSLKQWQQGKKTLTCQSGAPWTWCLNKPCTVDPANPKKAMCACDIVRTGASITAGGNCNTATCNTAYWSAAPADAFSDATNFVLKQLNIKKSPVRACPQTAAR